MNKEYHNCIQIYEHGSYIRLNKITGLFNFNHRNLNFFPLWYTGRSSRAKTFALPTKYVYSSGMLDRGGYKSALIVF